MIDLVCIIGLGHSGSTLMDMVLGSHEQVLSLGEIKFFNTWLTTNPTCTCGQPFRQCEFWSIVLDRLLALKLIDPSLSNDFSTDIWWLSNRSIWNQTRHLVSVAGLEWFPSAISRLAMRYIAPEIDQRVKNTLQLYEILRSVSGRQLLVDSSKFARRTKALFAYKPDSTRVVHLTRDGRAWVASQLHRTRWTVAEGAHRWVEDTRRTRQILKTMPADSCRHIRYEEISRQPEIAFKSICEFLELDFRPDMLDFRMVAHHNVGGNPMRLRADRSIVEDTKWRQELSSDQVQEFDRVAGELNRQILGEWYVS